ncbi:MAG: M6 family metalloprotease domain-containing protein [Candidatus Eisenbacteria bacterium]|nr:M6 family metalloprotease domain-containing protein [Candidatus Eisenbacteria bacterium]
MLSAKEADSFGSSLRVPPHRTLFSTPLAVLVFLTLILNASIPVFAPGRCESAPDKHKLMPLNPDVVEYYSSRGLKVPYAQTEASFTLAPGSRVNRMERPTRLNKSGSTTLKALVILVEFLSAPPGGPTSRYSPGVFDSMLFGTTYIRGGADTTINRTLKNFYQEVSYGTVDIVTLNAPSTVGWITVSNPYTYYCEADGTHDHGFGPEARSVRGLVADACTAADSYVDFSKYAVGGVVENLFIVHAGTGAEWSGDPAVIWSHQWNIGDWGGTGLYLDGVRIDSYSMEPECGGNTTGYGGPVSGPFLPTVGVYAHEFGHVLGLPDEYDYGSESWGTGRFSLMAGGSWNRSPDLLECNGNSPAHPSAWGVARLGLVTPTTVTGAENGFRLPPIETNGTMLKVEQYGSGGKEYWLFENRQQIGFDEGFTMMTQDAHGLLIYHVDENILGRFYWRPNEAECVLGGQYYGNMNCNCATLPPNPSTGEKWYGISVEQADGLYELELKTSRGNAGDFYSSVTGKTVFDPSSTPNTSSYYGCTKLIAARNISEAGDTITLDVTADVVPPSVTVTIPNGGETWIRGSYQDIAWNATDNISIRSVNILVSTDGGATYPDTVVSNQPNDGIYSWLVPDLPSEQCRIKVIALDAGLNTTEDASDSVFRINPQDQSSFVKALGGSDDDLGFSIIQASNGGLVVTGETKSYGAGGNDLLLMKLDSSGNHLWTSVLGGSSEDYGSSVTQTSDGGFAVTGGTNSLGSGDYDVLIAKFDSAGTHLWTQTLGDMYEDYGSCIIETSDSCLVVTGTTGGYGASSNDLLLVKLDSLGNILWTRVLGGNTEDYGFSVVETSDKGFVVTGKTNSFGAGGSDILLTKFDSAGNHLWTKVFGGSYDEYGSSLVKASDEGFVVTGRTNSYGDGDYDLLVASFDSTGSHSWTRTVGGVYEDYGSSVVVASGGLVMAGGTYSYGVGYRDLLLTKFDLDGNHVWTRALGGTSEDFGSSLAAMTDDGFAVAGGTGSYGTGGSNVLLPKFDGQGTSCSGVTLISPSITSPTPTTSSPPVSVNTGSLTLAVQTPAVLSPTPTTTTVCETETGIEKRRDLVIQHPILPFHARVSNPASSSIRALLTVPKTTVLKIAVYDAAGRKIGRSLVFNDVRAGTHTFQIPSSRLKSGVYFVLFEAGGAKEVVKVVKIK